MSTRALYTFYPGADGWPEQPIHVYRRHDGYPTGAADAIVSALEFAWPLPRYEHDEFAAAFIAANKSHWIAEELRLLRKLAELPSHDAERIDITEQLARVRDYAKNGNGGGVRVCCSGDFEEVAPHDLEFWYTISPKKPKGVNWPSVHQLIVTCYAVNHRSIEWKRKRDGSEHMVTLPKEKQGWKIEKLFTAPLKSGDTLKAKAKEWSDKRWYRPGGVSWWYPHTNPADED